MSRTSSESQLLTRTKVDVPAPKSKSTFKSAKGKDAYTTYCQSFPFFKYNCTDVYIILAKASTEAFGGTVEQDGAETENNANVDSIIESICSLENGKKQYEELLDEMQIEGTNLRELIKNDHFYKSTRPEGWINFKMFAILVNMLSQGTADEKSKTLYHILQ